MKKGNHSVLVDIAGVLLAFVIAFGALVLVQGLLRDEEARLLDESGRIEIMVRAEDAQLGETEVQLSILTQEELVQVVECLNRETEVGLHEPLSGQLSMAQAVQCGREWLSDFFLPHLSLEDSVPQEYSCYLWGRLENGETGGEAEQMFSYWTIILTGQELSAELVLNAVTGQVLSAAVRCSEPVQYQEDHVLDVLLEDYWKSFALDADYSVIDRGDGGASTDDRSGIRGMGNDEISAFLEVNSIVVSSAQPEFMETQDWLIVRLYLETEG